MPDPLREPFRGIAYELMWLHAKWNNYTALFAAEADHSALLNATAPACFRIIHACMKNDILLSLARLTDPPSSLGRKNLSFPRLMAILRDAGYSDAANRCNPDLEALLDACKPVRTRRNKLLAHADLATLVGEDSQPLPLIPPSLFTEALVHARKILNTIEATFRESETAYQVPILRGEAQALLMYLRKGLEASEEERRLALAG
jgi:hypothetical protein